MTTSKNAPLRPDITSYRDLFPEALERSRQLERTQPDVTTIKSIIAQLSHLLRLAEGESTDQSRLSDIVLGVQAAGEIETLDPKFAEMLYEVSRGARRL